MLLDYLGSDNVAFFADNNVNIQGSLISGIEVIAPSRLNGYADNLHKCSGERIEFFMHTADVRGVKPAGGRLRIRQTELLDATLKVKNLAESIGIHIRRIFGKAG